MQEACGHSSEMQGRRGVLLCRGQGWGCLLVSLCGFKARAPGAAGTRGAQGRHLRWGRCHPVPWLPPGRGKKGPCNSSSSAGLQQQSRTSGCRTEVLGFLSALMGLFKIKGDEWDAPFADVALPSPQPALSTLLQWGTGSTLHSSTQHPPEGHRGTPAGALGWIAV